MAGREMGGIVQPSNNNATGERAAGSTSPTKSSTTRVADRAATQNKEAAKLKQIIQHFFTKAALTIVSSRVDLPQCFYRDTNQIRSNRWFNLVLDESDILTEDVEEWALIDVMEEQPPALVIEIYLDTRELTRNQTLAVIDERNNRWDICEALAAPSSGAAGQKSRREKPVQVILERWRISLDDPDSDHSSGAGDSMPNIYKKAVVMFRSLYTYCRFLPAWKFGRRLAKQQNTLSALRPMYRIVKDTDSRDPRDFLSAPLYPSAERTVDTHYFKPTKSPAGLLSIQVSYRTNCNFRIDDSEALLSSRFMGMDDHYFQPSLESGSNRDQPTVPYHRRDAGSLPSDKRWTGERPAMGQAYGSMSTFHNAGGPPGTSPISALRAAGEIASESPPDSEVHSQRASPSPRPTQGSKASARPPPAEGELAAVSMQRRVSVSFQPFKAGSLSSSPGPGTPVPPSPTSRTSTSASNATGPGTLSHTRNRTSLSALPQAALRVPPATAQTTPGPGQAQTPSSDIAVGSPSSGSPKIAAVPMSRYSSSFSNRRSRLSSTSAGTTASKTEEDNNSSGKGSQSSSTQPGSGLLTEGEVSKGEASPAPADDDDNISDFLKMLEQKKGLKSFQKQDESSRDASARRTSEQLSRFQKLRESHSALTESMSSSTMLQRSSNSSSRQLSSVPPGLVGNSVSTSSSPGKPISPHTPAIPSRLSAGANINDLEGVSSRTHRDQQHHETDEEFTSGPDMAVEGGIVPHGTTAIDIPHIRQPSSMLQQRRAALNDFDNRSSSLPIEDRPDLTMGELDQLVMHSGGAMDNGDRRSSLGARGSTQRSRSHNHPIESRRGSNELLLTATTSSSADSSTVHDASTTTTRRHGYQHHRASSSSASSTAAPAATLPAQQQQSQQATNARSSSRTATPGTMTGTAARPRLSRGSAAAGRGSAGSGSSRFSFNSSTRPGTTSTVDDDEPLLFTLSELGSHQSSHNNRNSSNCHATSTAANEDVRGGSDGSGTSNR